MNQFRTTRNVLAVWRLYAMRPMNQIATICMLFKKFSPLQRTERVFLNGRAFALD